MLTDSSGQNGWSVTFMSIVKLFRSFYGMLFAFCFIFLVFLSYMTYMNQTSLLYLPMPQALLSTATLSDVDFETIEHNFYQKPVNCAALFAGDEEEVTKAVALAKTIARKVENKNKKTHYRAVSKVTANKIDQDLLTTTEEWIGDYTRLTNQWYLNATQDCLWFMQKRGYITSSLTKEEEEFPIAFSILVFKDIEMVERLLRSVYRPQNRYCIHVDSKSEPEFFAALQAIVRCFSDNVFMSRRRVNVQWGTFTVLEPELICMGDLWSIDEKENYESFQNKTLFTFPGNKVRERSHRHSAAENKSTFNKSSVAVIQKPSVHYTKMKKWKYFINLTGQEFPLKTNYELVKILRAYKGANNEEGTRKRANKDRWQTKAPHGILPAKGAVHTVINRATVDYILHSPVAQDFIEWLKHTGVPDETLFASINYNPQLHIPGTYNGSDIESVNSYNRYKMWYGENCYSHQTVRAICILSTGDLKNLGASPHLFANKFYLHQDRIAVGCLEEKLFNDTREEYFGRKTFNTNFYTQQDFVKNRVMG